MNLNKINIETLINYDLNIGKELPLKLRLKFEDFFQTDFSKVRIYEGFIDPEIGALALTSGSQILFALGNYCPDLKNGQRLIAHELTHVIQQREGRIPINNSASPYLLDDFELENEAEQCADAFISGQKHANITRAHNSY
jgi:Zn-dependent peptidase ImmA (M78 family)